MMKDTLKNETREEKEKRLRDKVTKIMELAADDRAVKQFLISQGYSPNRAGKRAYAKKNQVPIRHYALQEAERMIQDAVTEKDQELVQHEDTPSKTG